MVKIKIPEKVRNQIRDLIISFMDSIIKRRVEIEPFNENNKRIEKPFGSRLVPMEIWKGSTFERSFVTVLGQIGFEKIAVILGKVFHLNSKQNYHLVGEYSQGENNEIHKIIDELDHPIKGTKRTIDWDSEIERIEDVKNNKMVSIEVISDVWIKMKEKELFIELKSAKPNKDQSKVSKEKCFKIHCIKKKNAEPYETYFALTTNPYGSREKYAHGPPNSYFDMKNSKIVLMGKEFWDYISAPGVYEELLEIFEEVGINTQKRIREEYLNLE